MVLILREVEIELTPGELAQEFWNMNEDEMVSFLNNIGDILISTNTYHRVNKLRRISINQNLENQAKFFIEKLHNSICVDEYKFCEKDGSKCLATNDCDTCPIK